MRQANGLKFLRPVRVFDLVGPGWEPSSERIGAGTNPFRLSHAPLAQSPPYSSPMGVS
jgi:hypothetical protein